MMGNLGNQMFIYAMARAIQLEYNLPLTIDKSGLKREYYTANYKLDCLNIPNDINYNLNSLPKGIRLKYKLSSYIFHLQYGIIRRLRKNLIVPAWITKFWFNYGCIYNVNRQYFDYPKTNKKNLNIYGYFQSEKYFIKYKDIICKELMVSTPISSTSKKVLDDIRNSNSVAVSIRAKKNPENPKVNDNIKLGMIDKAYYYEGMKKISEIVHNPVFYIFADDIDIVKNEYEFPFPVVYVYPEDALDGMRLMYNCKDFIISNSTFSWWGAYLSCNKNKKVVMPAIWDRQGPPRQDIYFGNPIKLKVNFLTK